jgi:hypothetical protein
MYLVSDAVIVVSYIYSSIQDAVDYELDNAVDVYAFYLAVGSVIDLICLFLLCKSSSSHFMTKRHVVMVAVVMGLFQVGTFFLSTVMTAQFWIEI